MRAGGTSPSTEQLASMVVIISEARARCEREAYAIPIAALGAGMTHGQILSRRGKRSLAEPWRYRGNIATDTENPPEKSRRVLFSTLWFRRRACRGSEPRRQPNGHPA